MAVFLRLIDQHGQFFHRTKTANWANSNAFHENSLTYDGNGNILTLKRYDKSGSLMDDLTYDYGTGASRSNQLLGVADGGDFGNGFVDGNSSGADYTYDVQRQHER